MSSAKWIIGGTVAGIIGGAMYLSKNKGTSHEGYVDPNQPQPKKVIQAFAENRETVVEKLRESGSRLSTIFDRASDDVKEMVQAGQKMRYHLDDVMDVLKDVNSEWKNFIDENVEKPKRIGESNVEINHVPDQPPLSEQLDLDEKDKL
ncbi:hypothetical protein FLK61_27905 [Paenalkalicoccus suaedae]|uniref:Uncharacterized protein n=1 Tax=Paenalkalicoccus suaedae TaxID=2592382 RepID=A0A859FCL3_9BACI|nr:hypothetical protein [Paenalkalicoccus suaedae]QKS70578.1 hypothetical protein FLK61_27905 [Paenalkalicoccus suaedae]